MDARHLMITFESARPDQLRGPIVGSAPALVLPFPAPSVGMARTRWSLALAQERCFPVLRPGRRSGAAPAQIPGRTGRAAG